MSDRGATLPACARGSSAPRRLGGFSRLILGGIWDSVARRSGRVPAAAALAGVGTARAGGCATAAGPALAGVGIAQARRGALAVTLGLAALVMAPGEAAAGDGAYGRLEGDLDASLGAGVALAAGAPAFAARLSLVYAQAAGLYGGYADSFGQREALYERSIAAGVTLKPLFWGRFARDMQTGNARLDLFIDSFILEVGAFWATPQGGPMYDKPGIEIGAGLGIPLFAEATGPFIEVRGAWRIRPVDFAGTTSVDPIGHGALLTFTLAWHHVVPVHIADAGDRLVR